jgi:hypothetical protein
MTLQAWYSPSFNGDFRFTPHPEDPSVTVLWVSKPTPAERKQLLAIYDKALARNWVNKTQRPDFEAAAASRVFKKKLLLGAPLEEVGPVVTSVLRPGRAVLTAVRFKDGQIEVCETSAPEKPPESHPYRKSDPPKALPPKPSDTPSSEAIELAKKPDAVAAATVKRHTPCCPPCYVDATGPATEALIAFMTEEQHAMWARQRCLMVRGGLSGHRYLIAHRNSPLAAQWQHIAHDLDDKGTLHFHDWLVPPEEEVLAAMLILGSKAEPWLRNEATTFFGTGVRFKNPFGDGGDGVIDSGWTQAVGLFAQGLLGLPRSRRLHGEVGDIDSAPW